MIELKERKIVFQINIIVNIRSVTLVSKKSRKLGGIYNYSITLYANDVGIHINETNRYLHTVNTSTTPMRVANTTLQIAQVINRHANLDIFLFLNFSVFLDRRNRNQFNIIKFSINHRSITMALTRRLATFHRRFQKTEMDCYFWLCLMFVCGLGYQVLSQMKRNFSVSITEIVDCSVKHY